MAENLTPETQTTTSTNSVPPDAPVGARAFLNDLIKFTIIAFLIVAPIRYFVAQPFIVNGTSMDPTFKDGDYLIVDELSYELSNPERGQVVIFKYPKDPSLYFIKRIIGLPGETVNIDHGMVTIGNSNGAHPLPEPYLVFKNDTTMRITLGPNQYFVMGDNRPRSSDSRFWGPVPRRNMVGHVFLRLFPFDKIGVYPGASISN